MPSHYKFPPYLSVITIAALITSLVGCDSKQSELNNEERNTNSSNSSFLGAKPEPQKSNNLGLAIKGLYLGMDINNVVPALERALGSNKNEFRFYTFRNQDIPNEGECESSSKTAKCDAVLFWIKKELAGNGNKKILDSEHSINIGLNEEGTPQDSPVLLGRAVADRQGRLIFFQFRGALMGTLFSLDNSVSLDEFVKRFETAYNINFSQDSRYTWSYRSKDGTYVKINQWDIFIENVSTEESRKASFN
ncbi:hypothetical protein ACO0K9_20285 [Undibacterium sp. Ji50W]|uniref:hypothetical protein n=1 Tax=Undibacterium sp. Ji50W TaxID=3413041 RepID=UPI003BF2ADA6